MTILLGNGSKVDLAEPLRLADDQYDRLHEFLLSEFFVEEGPMHGVREKRLNNSFPSRDWSRRERVKAFNMQHDLTETGRLLARGEMSVQMQLGGHMDSFFRWAQGAKVELGALSEKEFEALLEKYDLEIEQERIAKRQERAKNSPGKLRREQQRLEGLIQSMQRRLATKPKDEQGQAGLAKAKAELAEVESRLANQS